MSRLLVPMLSWRWSYLFELIYTHIYINEAIDNDELLDIMDLNESWRETYLIMDNFTIHKPKPMIRKIESKGYRVMYLPSYSRELNPIEQNRQYWPTSLYTKFR